MMRFYDNYFYQKNKRLFLSILLFFFTLDIFAQGNFTLNTTLDNLKFYDEIYRRKDTLAEFETFEPFYLPEFEVEDTSFTKKLVEFLKPFYEPVYFLAKVFPNVLFFILFVLTFISLISAVIFSGLMRIFFIFLSTYFFLAIFLVPLVSGS